MSHSIHLPFRSVKEALSRTSKTWMINYFFVLASARERERERENHRTTQWSQIDERLMNEGENRIRAPENFNFLSLQFNDSTRIQACWPMLHFKVRYKLSNDGGFKAVPVNNK